MQRYNLSVTNGHFTAMVNAHTDRLGCGVLRDPELSTVYVCNYYPAGNIYVRQPRQRSSLSSNAMVFLPAYQIVGDSEKNLTTKQIDDMKVAIPLLSSQDPSATTGSMSVESTSATTPAVTKAAKRDDHTKANDGSEETTKVNLPRCASIPREREALTHNI